MKSYQNSGLAMFHRGRDDKVLQPKPTSTAGECRYYAVSISGHTCYHCA